MRAHTNTQTHTSCFSVCLIDSFLSSSEQAPSVRAAGETKKVFHYVGSQCFALLLLSRPPHPWWSNIQSPWCLKHMVFQPLHPLQSKPTTLDSELQCLPLMLLFPVLNLWHQEEKKNRHLQSHNVNNGIKQINTRKQDLTINYIWRQLCINMKPKYLTTILWKVLQTEYWIWKSGVT